MKCYDAVVIGGGVLGCFVARALQRWQMSTLLIEAAEDVCSGVTCANSAIVYPGYDNQPGSLKAQMTVASNTQFARLCETLEVPFVRCGSLMTSHGEQGTAVLRQKKKQGVVNGVSDLQLLSGDAARALEPRLASDVVAALVAPQTGTVNPWQLGIAAYENARHNGCDAWFGSRVEAIHRVPGGYVLETSGKRVQGRTVINCAGLFADQVQEMVFPPSVRLRWDAATYLVINKQAPLPRHILFQETEDAGKGLTVVPTVEGTFLVASPAHALTTAPWATDETMLRILRQQARQFLPGFDEAAMIRSFAAVRPNPYHVTLQNGQWLDDGRKLGDFVIATPTADFFSLIGVKTPGLTCAPLLGSYLARRVATYLRAKENPAFDPRRPSIQQKEGPVVCYCGQVTAGEVAEAIRRGARTVDGVKRRVGTGMGPCQGGRCQTVIETYLERADHGTH